MTLSTGFMTQHKSIYSDLKSHKRQHRTGYFKYTDMGMGTKVRGNEVWEESVILTQKRQ